MDSAEVLKIASCIPSEEPQLLVSEGAEQTLSAKNCVSLKCLLATEELTQHAYSFDKLRTHSGQKSGGYPQITVKQTKYPQVPGAKDHGSSK